LTLVCLISMQGWADDTRIFRCSDADGRVTFSDRGCPGQRAYTPAPAPSVTFTPIAAEDRERLREARRRDTQTREAQRQARIKRRQHQLHQRDRRHQRCEAANKALRELLARRRKGYTLGDQHQLDAEERALKHSKRVNC
jgi:hypothetical protein